MIRSLVLLALAMAACACTETRVIKDNSANAKFAKMFGGDAATSEGSSGGWIVAAKGRASNQPSGPVSPTALKIAEMLKRQSNAPRPAFQDRNPGNWKITTSFPTGAQGQPSDQQPPANMPQDASPEPWGATPITPTLPGAVLPTVPTATPAR